MATPGDGLERARSTDPTPEAKKDHPASGSINGSAKKEARFSRSPRTEVLK
jgi:hypothetical protein